MYPRQPQSDESGMENRMVVRYRFTASTICIS